MKVRELLTGVAKILEDEELALAISTSTENQTPSVKVKAERLLYAFNLVISDVALNYLAPTFTENIVGKFFNIENLSKVCKKIVGIYDQNENPISYKIVGEKVEVGKSNCVVTYEYIPKNKGFDDDFEYQNKMVSERAFCYGVLAEYCLFTSRFEEAENWESKFRQAIEVKIDFKPKRIKAGKRWGL